MPIYEYACSACGHQFEEWQKMSDKPVRTCPKCKAKKVEKLISHTSFHLKGGGWYSDLYAGPKPGASKDSKESKDSQGSQGSKDSKGTNDHGASKDSTSKEAKTSSPSTTKTTTKAKKSEAGTT
jgi:putative FmdB family regulatory protein